MSVQANKNTTSTTTMMMNHDQTGAHLLSESEQVRRNRRKGSYHLVASRNRLPSDQNDREEDGLFRYLTTNESLGRHAERSLATLDAKKNLLSELARSGGDVTTASFAKVLQALVKLYDPTKFDARKLPRKPSKNKRAKPGLEGMWIDLSCPKFSDCLGVNSNNDFMYTLGRMSFDMFRPTNLKCSIQGVFNPVHFVNGTDMEAIQRVPESLKRELHHGCNVLRSYDIVTAFTIEPRNPTLDPDCPNTHVDRPIEGLMTTYGYVLPNPENPSRLSIWFTGGTIEVNTDPQRWKKVFSPDRLQKRKLKERTRLLGAKLIMGATPAEGMEADGKMTYHLNRPIGGHDRAYVDLIYLDENLRIAKSHSGVVYVFSRVPYFPDE